MSVAVLELLDGAVAYDADADTTVERDVRAGPCTLKRVKAVNSSGAAAYLKFHDDVAPTAGTTEPRLVIFLPAGATVVREVNLEFSTGLSFWCSDAAGKTLGNPPGSSGVLVDLEF